MVAASGIIGFHCVSYCALVFEKNLTFFYWRTYFIFNEIRNNVTQPISIAGVVSGLQPGHYSSQTAPNLQHTANQERNDQCGNQHHS